MIGEFNIGVVPLPYKKLYVPSGCPILSKFSTTLPVMVLEVFTLVFVVVVYIKLFAVIPVI